MSSGSMILLTITCELRIISQNIWRRVVANVLIKSSSPISFLNMFSIVSFRCKHKCVKMPPSGSHLLPELSSTRTITFLHFLYIEYEKSKPTHLKSALILIYTCWPQVAKVRSLQLRTSVTGWPAPLAPSMISQRN